MKAACYNLIAPSRKIFLWRFPMASRILTILSILATLSSVSVSQQTACRSTEIRVGVISANVDFFLGLAAEDFVGHLQKKPVSIKTITYDDGPRRVLLVVDASK